MHTQPNMTIIINLRRRIWGQLLLASIFFGLGYTASASETKLSTENMSIEALVAELDKEFARGSIASIQLAELALSKLEMVQSQMQNQLHDREIACHEEFFTNSCLQDVRLKKRQLQETLRQISIEAKSLLRRARVAKFQSLDEKS